MSLRKRRKITHKQHDVDDRKLNEQDRSAYFRDIDQQIDDLSQPLSHSKSKLHYEDPGDLYHETVTDDEGIQEQTPHQALTATHQQHNVICSPSRQQHAVRDAAQPKVIQFHDGVLFGDDSTLITQHNERQEHEIQNRDIVNELNHNRLLQHQIKTESLDLTLPPEDDSEATVSEAASSVKNETVPFDISLIPTSPPPPPPPPPAPPQQQQNQNAPDVIPPAVERAIPPVPALESEPNQGAKLQSVPSGDENVLIINQHDAQKKEKSVDTQPEGQDDDLYTNDFPDHHFNVLPNRVKSTEITTEIEKDIKEFFDGFEVTQELSKRSEIWALKDCATEQKNGHENAANSFRECMESITNLMDKVRPSESEPKYVPIQIQHPLCATMTYSWRHAVETYVGKEACAWWDQYTDLMFASNFLQGIAQLTVDSLKVCLSFISIQ